MGSSSFEQLLDVMGLNLGPTSRQRLSQAYDDRCSPTRVLPQAQDDHSKLTLAHVGAAIYVVNEGLLHVFELAPDADPLTQDRAALIRAYQAHLEDPDAHASDPYWTLNMDERAGIRLCGWGGEGELAAIFQAAGLDTIALERRLIHRVVEPELMDAWERYSEERQAYHQAQADLTLAAVRDALPEGLLARLNRFDLGVGELAHWAMAQGIDHFEYRLQAIEQQPYLLSRALMASGQWALPRDKMTGPKPMDNQPTPITQELRTQGKILAEAIDAGQSWADHLLPILNNRSVSLCSNWRPQKQRSVSCSNHGSQLTLADVQLLSGKPSPQSFTWMLLDKAPNYSIQMSLLSGMRELSAARRPKTADAARLLARIVERTQDRIPLRGKGMDAFLKGLPNDLDDPIYQEMERRWPLVADTYRWMHQGAFRHVDLMHAFRTLTWLQVNKFADRAHAIELQLRQYNTVAATLEWTPSLRVEAPTHDGLHLHELCTEQELQAEGHQMAHCVGSYGVQCGMGKVRIFSVRDAEGKRMSTLAVERVRGTDDLVIQQHYGPCNKSPPPAAQSAVEQWLAQATLLFKKERWLPTAGAQERVSQESNAVLPAPYGRKRPDATPA